MRKSTSGFTIVELLIVIVIIAILAAITIVAFNGAATRANDTRVQADLLNTAKTLGVYKALNGTYPHGPTATDVGTMLEAVNLKFVRDAYDTNPTTANANIFYADNNDGEDFVIVVKAKSGKTIYYSSKVSGVRDYPGNPFPQSGGTYIKTLLGMDGEHVWGYGGGNWSTWAKQ